MGEGITRPGAALTLHSPKGGWQGAGNIPPGAFDVSHP
jgi:hypothetical protein